MSMYGWDVAVLPGPPKADLQRCVLEEWLNNPFLDDDVTALCLRLGEPAKALEDALESLCRGGFLKQTGTGFVLALDLGGTLPALDTSTTAAESESGSIFEGTETAATDATPATTSEGAEVQLASLSGAVATDPPTDVVISDNEDLLDLLSVEGRGDALNDALTWEIEQTLAELMPTDGIDEAQLIEALPFGMMVLLPTGAREMANLKAAEMLGVAPGQLDGATFEIVTGVNPLTALDTDSSVSFSITEPRALEVTLHGHRLPSGTVILILLRDVSLLEEVSQIQAEVQEELFQRLKTEMVDPLATLERFLEKPDQDRLVQARIAMEQINWFLQEFFLRDGDRD
jgi:hypothetical protein